MYKKLPPTRGAVEFATVSSSDYLSAHKVQVDSDSDIAEQSRLFAELIRSHPHWLQKPETKQMCARMLRRIVLAGRFK